MKILLHIIGIIVALWTVQGQKECFTKKPRSSEGGPLKMALSDPIKDF
jgi:hypothetical protein